jgi:dTDP-glucose 4,6-dehydratase
MTPCLLVTGGAGFIGSNFVLATVRAGKYRVCNLDKLTYAGNEENLASLAGDPRHVFVKGDICDRPLVKELLTAHRPVGIVNFAAESHVDRSIDGPGEFVRTNVVGTFELLEAARAHASALTGDDAKRFRFLHVSTDEVYGSLGPEGFFTEESRYAPNSPYSASKAGADLLVRAYHHTYGLSTITTNCSNNYGPYQFPEKLIPLCLLNALEGKPLPIYGDGKNVRDWLFVDDHCEAVMAAFERGVSGETYAFGGRSERTNLEVVHTLCDLLDELSPSPAGSGRTSYRELMTFVKDRPGHDKRYAIDPSRAERDLGWKAKHDFTTGMRATVRFYLEHRDWCARITNGTYRRERLGLAPATPATAPEPK